MEKKSFDVADYLLTWRRGIEGESAAGLECLRARIAAKVYTFIKRDLPIPMTIVGFPFKSAARSRCISQNADMAEYWGLRALSDITNGVEKIYDTGADLAIFGDGRILCDTVIGASDENTTKYVGQIKNILDMIGNKRIKYKVLDDFYCGDPQNMRESLARDFRVTSKDTENILRDEFVWRRIFEAKEIHDIDPTIPQKEVKKLAKQIVTKEIERDAQYRKFVSCVTDEKSVRLSVHQKPAENGESKIGIYLNPKKQTFCAPWHGAALCTSNGEFLTIDRAKNLALSGHKITQGDLAHFECIAIT
jgi:pyoverdine/dityrosine biosynthesis protein Dit1